MIRLSHFQHPAPTLGHLLAACVVGASALSLASPALASSLSARLALGPSIMSTSSANDFGDSSGPALLTQLDVGVRVRPILVLHGTLIYDYSRWLQLSGRGPRYEGSMLGLGLGGTLRLGGISVGASAGGQFTFFPQGDDAASGPNGASLGPFISGNVGYVWPLAPDVPFGVHLLARYRRSKDETNSQVYDPSGYQLGLVLSIGLDGEPLLGR
jgi:hypothetical protein